MAQVIYINPDPTTKDRATLLGCGWMPFVPPQYTSLAVAPCVILNGAGQTVVISDNPPTTRAIVAAALQPILDAELAIQTAEGAANVNRDTLRAKAQTALNANATYLAIASPNNAQVAAQVQVLTKECNAIIRLLISQFDSTVGT